MDSKTVTAQPGTSPTAWIWLLARIVSFGGLAVLLPPGPNLLGVAVGWGVILTEKRKAGVPLAAMWSVAAILMNLMLYARLTSGVVG